VVASHAGEIVTGNFWHPWPHPKDVRPGRWPRPTASTHCRLENHVMAADAAYVAQHQDVISRTFAEAVACLVDVQAADPIAALHEHFADRSHASEQNKARALEFEQMKQELDKERQARALLGARVSELEMLAQPEAAIADGAAAATVVSSDVAPSEPSPKTKPLLTGATVWPTVPKAAGTATISDEEKASFKFEGTRARPRKKIVAVPRRGETYLKAPGSCLGRWPSVGLAVEAGVCDGCSICASRAHRLWTSHTPHAHRHLRTASCAPPRVDGQTRTRTRILVCRR
jgi:hypothetical protein